MVRHKIDYGIQLGLHHAAISRMENGVPVIIKSDTLKDKIPVCVGVSKRGALRVGDSVLNEMKRSLCIHGNKKMYSECFFEGFQRTMGTDFRFHCISPNKDFSSIELTAEVLKKLKSFVTDENFSSVVITVPTRFTVNQKTATMEAAKLAGFDHCELVQEPVAASMAYGMKSEQKNSCWMVFDFGCGSFEVSLVKVEDGIISVLDTDRDNYLGGNCLDYAIVDDIIVPYLKDEYKIDSFLSNSMKKEVLRDAMKSYAEDTKNKLSFIDRVDVISFLGELGEDDYGEEIELDLSVTQSQAYDVMRPYYQKAVDICKELLKRNGISGEQVDNLILVGGPTHSPLVRQMLREQVAPNVDTSIDPLTAVVTGAALYASTKNAEIKDDEIEIGTVRLNIDYPETTVESTIWASVILDKIASGANCPDKVYVEVLSADKSWSSGKTEVNEAGNVIEVLLNDGKANNYTVVTYDSFGNRLKCFPEEITILGGTVVSSAPLPYHIGIAAWDAEKQRNVFLPLNGLEKNQPLPAVGVRNDRKTSTILRPGIVGDKITFPIYQASYYENNISARLFEHVADIDVDGTEIDKLIPAGSTVELTVKVDSSVMMAGEIYFPQQNIRISKEIFARKIQSVEELSKRISYDIQEGQVCIDNLRKDGINTSVIQTLLNNVKEEESSDIDRRLVMQHLKQVFGKIEDLENSTEWERTIKKANCRLHQLNEIYSQVDNEIIFNIARQFRDNLENVERSRDLTLLKSLNNNISSQMSFIDKELKKYNVIQLSIKTDILDGNSANSKLVCILPSEDCQLKEFDFKIIRDSSPSWESEYIKVTELGAVVEIDDTGGSNHLRFFATHKDYKYIKLNINTIIT